jgi:type I restriction enzyme M protein
MPRTNDGALLFLQTMLAKMQPHEKGGSRIAIIFNGSPLSNGDCGSGEGEIRRSILENDWLDAVVMLPDQLFYNTGIFTYVWLLRNEKPASHRGRVMLIDARKQFEKEPKSFGNKRNRITEAHRDWIAQRYRDGWDVSYQDDDVKLFKNTDFAYHKVNVVFWQTDENDEPAMITEPYPKAFTAANIAKEQAFYASDLGFTVRLTDPATGGSAIVAFTLAPDDSFPKVFESAAREVFAAEIEAATKDATDKKKAVKRFLDALRSEAEWTHRHYVKDDEYIPYGEDIEAFLNREIAKPIIRWKETEKNGKTILGYEILPNKYFYRYQPPTPAKDLLAEFWRLEKEAEKMLEGLAAGAQ